MQLNYYNQLFFVTATLFFHSIFAHYFLFSDVFFPLRCTTKRTRRTKRSNQAIAGVVQPGSVAKAGSKTFRATVFKFPVTSVSENATGVVEGQFSVSSTTRQRRVVVTVKTKTGDSASCTVSCSGRQCQP